jgi:hypothetical protein
VPQEERSIFGEVLVSVILSKKVYMYMCPIPNGFRDRAISLYSILYTVQTSNTPCPHTSCKVHWCWRWNFRKCTARVFSRDSPGKVAQWTGRPIRESWRVLWLVIRLLSVWADVSSSVRSILPCTERLYCIPLHTCQHAGALPATTNTSRTPCRRTVRTKYHYCSILWRCHN